MFMDGCIAICTRFCPQKKRPCFQVAAGNKGVEIPWQGNVFIGFFEADTKLNYLSYNSKKITYIYFY